MMTPQAVDTLAIPLSSLGCFTVTLRFIEDALESPPLNRVAFLQLVLVGVKKAYDIINGAQKLLEIAINVAVTLLAVVLAVAYVLALAFLNLAALGLVILYLA